MSAIPAARIAVLHVAEVRVLLAYDGIGNTHGDLGRWEVGIREGLARTRIAGRLRATGGPRRCVVTAAEREVDVKIAGFTAQDQSQVDLVDLAPVVGRAIAEHIRAAGTGRDWIP